MLSINTKGSGSITGWTMCRLTTFRRAARSRPFQGLSRLSGRLLPVFAMLSALAGPAHAEVLLSTIGNEHSDNSTISIGGSGSTHSLVQVFRTGSSDETLGEVRMRFSFDGAMPTVSASLHEVTDPDFRIFFAPDLTTGLHVSDLELSGTELIGNAEVGGDMRDLHEFTLNAAAGTVLKAGTFYYIKVVGEGLIFPIAANSDIEQRKDAGWELGAALAYDSSDGYLASGTYPVLMLLNNTLTLDSVESEEVEEVEEVAESDPDGIHAEVFPELSRTLSDLTGRALSERIDQAGSGTPDTLSLGGAAGLAEALLSRASSLRNGTFDAAGFLSDSSFSLGSGERGRSTFWGSGSYRDLSDDTGPVHWDGAILGGHLGADTHLYPDVLAGLMVSVYDGDLDYVERREAGDVRGVYSLRLTSLNPYTAWRLASGARLWGTFGIGDGKVGLTAGESGAVHETALSQRSLTLGFRGPEQDLGGMIAGGGTTLTVKGAGTVSHGETAGTEVLEGLSVSTRRLRLLAEGRHERALSGAAQAHAALELGFRQDSGDGESGTGIELGGGAGYVNRASGLSVTGRVRTLLSDGSQVEEWGLSGSLVVDARPGSELGFAMSLEPAWGVARHGVAQALWSGESAGLAGTGSVPGGRLGLDMGYGIAVLGGRYAGIPHAGVALRESGRDFRLGYRLKKPGGAMEVGLAGRRHERDGGHGPEHVIELGGRLSW